MMLAKRVNIETNYRNVRNETKTKKEKLLEQNRNITRILRMKIKFSPYNFLYGANN